MQSTKTKTKTIDFLMFNGFSPKYATNQFCSHYMIHSVLLYSVTKINDFFRQSWVYILYILTYRKRWGSKDKVFFQNFEDREFFMEKILTNSRVLGQNFSCWGAF